MALKRLVPFFFITALLLAGCQSSHKGSSLYGRRAAQRGQTHRALFIYTSDSPKFLPYFSLGFNRRVNASGLFTVVQNQNIARSWFLAAAQEEHTDVSLLLSNWSKSIKESLQQKTFPKAQAQAQSAYKQVEFLLKRYPTDVSPASLAEFGFWAALAWSAGSSAVSSDQLNAFFFYQKYASIAQRSVLESSLDLSTQQAFSRLERKASGSFRQRDVAIQSDGKCDVYVNGQHLKSFRVSLPLSMKAFVSANCPDGVFETSFVVAHTKSIKVVPSIPMAFATMPSSKALPRSLIAAEYVATIVLIHWSKQENYMELVILNASDLRVIKRHTLSLIKEADRQKAGDTLMSYLSEAAKKLED